MIEPAHPFDVVLKGSRWLCGSLFRACNLEFGRTDYLAWPQPLQDSEGGLT